MGMYARGKPGVSLAPLLPLAYISSIKVGKLGVPDFNRFECFSFSFSFNLFVSHKKCKRETKKIIYLHSHGKEAQKKPAGS